VEDAVEELIAALRQPDVSSRYHAAERLAVLGPAAKLAVPVLQRMLFEDSSAIVRKSVALALGEIGAEDAIDDLKDVSASDEDQFVRHRAEQALHRLEMLSATLRHL
jgi:HEAT repeat protein